MSLKNPVTPPGIDPGTVRLVAQRLNHYATPGPPHCDRKWKILNLSELARPEVSQLNPDFIFESTFCNICCNTVLHFTQLVLDMRVLKKEELTQTHPLHIIHTSRSSHPLLPTQSTKKHKPQNELCNNSQSLKISKIAYNRALVSEAHHGLF
jgi:hypothetical protein